MKGRLIPGAEWRVICEGCGCEIYNAPETKKDHEKWDGCSECGSKLIKRSREVYRVVNEGTSIQRHKLVSGF